MQTLRIAGRSSPLSIIQVEEVLAKLPGVAAEFVSCDSWGDRHKELSLLGEVPADIFTRELDEAVLAGRVDCAVHSAKDLPYPLPQGLAVAALTDSVDDRDALVSRECLSLEALPPGAVVGTSSPARRDQLAALRPDLLARSIRGTIGERLEQLDRGEYDAIVVAAIALRRLGLEARIGTILAFATNPLQGSLAVTIRRDRPDLRRLFFPLDCRNRRGRVALVGAGPSAPDLLTRRAEAALAAADAIFFDALLDPAMLAGFAGEKIPVGKRAGHHPVPQDRINELLYRAAAAGKRVVRLKGGDPSVFGRSGEEAEYLARRFIPVEVVPGVGAVSAAAADLVLPLTERGVASSLSLETGHGPGALTGTAAPPTRAWYMAASVLPELVSHLAATGHAPRTPAVVVRNAGSVLEDEIFTDLSGLATVEPVLPALVIVGETVRHALKQPRFLYCGLDARHGSFLPPGRVVPYPLIEVKETPSLSGVDLEAFDALVFTSKTAVRLFFRRWSAVGKAVFAVGPATAAELVRHGIPAPLVGEGRQAAGLVPVIERSGVRRVLYPCSALSDNALCRHPSVERLPLYTVVDRPQPLLDLGKFDGVVFTAPSPVAAFRRLYGGFPAHLAYYCIGPVTAQSLRDQDGVREGSVIDVQAFSPEPG